jgi:hypothetical protein
MTTLNPKQAFNRFFPKVADELKSIRESEVIVLGLSFSLAEMANLGATAEQVNGARNLIHIFQNLWDKGDRPVGLPVVRLETYDVSTEQLIEMSKKPISKDKK